MPDHPTPEYLHLFHIMSLAIAALRLLELALEKAQQDAEDIYHGGTTNE